MEASGNAHFDDFLDQHRDTEFVEFMWVDFYGVLRMRKHTLWRAREMCVEGLPLRTSPVSMANAAPETISSSVGVNMMYPDWTSLRRIEAGHVAVFCYVHTSSGPPQSEIDEAQRCPRAAIRNVLECCQSRVGEEPLAGFELEFYLLDDPPTLSRLQAEPNDPRTYCSTASSMREAGCSCVQACVAALEASGIMVQQFHAEGDNAQHYEIVLAPGPLLESVDQMVIAQEIVKRTARRRGKWATFMPKPFATRASSGLHAHISFKRLHEHQSKAFLAGMLHRMPLLCAFGMPYDHSYRRVGFPMLSEWVSWGWENRDVAIRAIDVNHWELRPLDFTANPHLTMALYLAAGLLGVTEEQELVWQACQAPISSLTEEQRRAMGLVTRLPTALDDALKVLERDVMGLDKVVGKSILEFYCQVKRDQLTKFAHNGEVAEFDFLAKEF